MLKDTIQKASKDPVMKYVVWAVYLFIIVAVIIVIYKIYQAYKAGATAAGDAAGAAIVQQQTGITPARQLFIKKLAQDIRNDITLIPFTTQAIWVNDSDIANSLNKLVTAEEAKLCSSYFQQIAGFSLISVINSAFFHSKQYINADILNSIN